MQTAHVAKKRKPSAAKHFAKIEQISIAGITERMGPLGLHLYAQLFLLSAEALPTPQGHFEPVRPYLVCHSIELALKAFLSLRGVAMVELADGPYGHNLESLLRKAIDANLSDFVSLSEAQCEAIRLATTYYVGKLFEYPAVGEALSAYPQMPPMDVLFQTAAIFVNTLRGPCSEAK